MSSTERPVAIVTGASSGIGHGIRLALLEHGYGVVGTSRTISKSKELKSSADLVLVDGDISKKETAVKVTEATVSPGNINTPMHARDNHAALAKFHPLARMGEISDIVNAVLYLQNATFVTAENIRVDGGVHAGRQ
jgi:NAD(P)-dependent dehydrogenase (short-subunit alcohol dehydrogenase family)